jgi:acetyl-CoA carboxylase biotin carboxyl carrier protein
MSFDKLKEFIKLAKDEGLAELKYEGKDEKFSVKLPVASDVIYPSASVTPVVASTPSAGGGTPVAAKKDDGLLEVTSPFVGTFYRSPSPDSDPYVKTGDRISSGQVLCIIEAMKIMNEIESEVSGEVVEICVENETYVEFGQVLFRVKP